MCVYAYYIYIILYILYTWIPVDGLMTIPKYMRNDALRWGSAHQLFAWNQLKITAKPVISVVTGYNHDAYYPLLQINRCFRIFWILESVLMSLAPLAPAFCGPPSQPNRGSCERRRGKGFWRSPADLLKKSWIFRPQKNTGWWLIYD